MPDTLDGHAKSIIDQVIDLEGPERAAVLDRVCGHPELRRRVESLLALMEKDDGFLHQPTVTLTPPSRELTATERLGARIGPYTLRALIGEGGFGSVYRAEQSSPVRRQVALKIIKLGMDTRQVIGRFEAERQALARMDHPNIARVLDAGATDSGRPYFVMELVQGEPVTGYCDRQRLPIRERLDLFREICGAVQHAHQKGVIHRDLKPSNVLVSVVDGQAVTKVIDFGIAKATAGRLTDASLHTELHQLIGTPEYMSPEQADPSGSDIDTRSDVYSLGVLLYEILTGNAPFDRRRLRSAPFAEMQRILREEEPPRPSMRLAASSSVHVPAPAPGAVTSPGSSVIEIAQCRQTQPLPLTRAIRGDLDWIVLKCLEKDRSLRYETASALAEDIGRHLADEPVMATPPSAAYKFRKFVRRNRGLVFGGTAIGAIACIATVVSVGFAFSESRQRKAAETAKTRAEKAELESQSRADDLNKVAAFQERQLAGIDVEAMGSRIRRGIIRKARAAAERSNLPPDQVAARLDELEKSIAGSDFTGVAQEALNESVFQPTLSVIDNEFTNQPMVQARLLQTSATVLREMGLAAEGTVPQQEALAIHRRILGEDDRLTIDSMEKMGLLLLAQGKPGDAEPYLLEALDKARRVFGDSDEATLSATHNVGRLLDAQGKAAQADVYFHEALEKRRRILGDDHPDTILSLGDCGNRLRIQNKAAEAEVYCREALERSRRVLGDDHTNTLAITINLGAVLLDLGKAAEAEQFLRVAMDGMRRNLGDDNLHTIHAEYNLGNALRAKGEFAEAELHCRNALRAYRQVLGEDHQETLNASNGVAWLLYAEGKHAEAEPILRDTLERSRRALGDDNTVTLDTIANLGTLLYALGRPAEAEGYMQEVLERRRRVLGDEHPDTLTSIQNLGVLRLSQDKLAEAEPLIREAYERQLRSLGDKNPATLNTMSNLCNLLISQERFAEAEPFCTQAYETRRQVHGDESSFALVSMTGMGRLLRSTGKATEAVSLMAPSEAVARREFAGGNALRLGRFLAALGRARTAVGNYDAAEANLAESWGIIDAAPGTTNRDRKESLTGLVELFEAWNAAEPDRGHDTKAAEWREKRSLAEAQGAASP